MQLFVSKIRVCQTLQWALSLVFNFNVNRVQFFLHLLQKLSQPYLLICCKDCKQNNWKSAKYFTSYASFSTQHQSWFAPQLHSIKVIDFTNKPWIMKPSCKTLSHSDMSNVFCLLHTCIFSFSVANCLMYFVMKS